MRTNGSLARIRAALVASILLAGSANAQWVTTYEQFYLEAPHNWQFRERYMAADRLFNAFDYGHAILYETLLTRPNAPVAALEEREYDRLTKKILIRPPRVPLEEGAIEIAYVKLAPEAKQMFEWAHVLHRQIYDVLADERLTQVRKDAEVARLVAYYRTRGDVAFSSRPKSMVLMQEQPYSLAFRQRYPKFNGLIWGYHWLQVGLYEPLMAGRSVEERQSLVRATVARFWQMLGDPPRTMPHQMPMTAAVAPRFAERYPEAAIIFDNLHSMHDVISDILASPSVPRSRKRAEILLAARRYRDDTSFVVTRDAWRTMALHMGIENMGGPAVGFLPALPAPTVTYGAVMAHDDRTGAMTGFRYGQATGGAHAGMAMSDTVKGAAAANPHAGHAMSDSSKQTDRDTPPLTQQPIDERMPMSEARGPMMMSTYLRLLSDPVIRERINADTTLRRMAREAISGMPVEHREHLESLLDSASVERASPAPRRPAAKKPPVRPPAAKKPPDPHAGHQPPPAPKP